MTDLSHIPTEELLFDRQECFNDLAALAIAKIRGVKGYRYGSDVDDRIDKNLAMIETIRKECERRGFDPAQYQAERAYEK
jgi:hypothetical protein